MYEMKICSCGCGNSYPQGTKKPIGWTRVGDSILRSDGVLFSKGDTIQRFSEIGKQHKNMIIQKIDFYDKSTFCDMYIRAGTKDGTVGIDITDTERDYENATNPNTLRFIQKVN